MKRISFNPRFVNEAGNDLIPGKIHTIRQNYDYWKKFKGKEVALFVWKGKPYRSKMTALRRNTNLIGGFKIKFTSLAKWRFCILRISGIRRRGECCLIG